MTQRDASGRFTKRTPAEKVSAHVEHLNERHPAPFSPGRSQPIEYDDDRQVWPWVLACGFVVFILVTAIWVMTH